MNKVVVLNTIMIIVIVYLFIVDIDTAYAFIIASPNQAYLILKYLKNRIIMQTIDI